MNRRLLHIGDTEDGETIYLTPDERSTGVHVLGAPGSGKSQLANHMIEQDLQYLPGGGLVIDPHGNDPSSLYQQALLYSTYFRPRRRMYFVNLSEPRFTYGFHAFAPRGGADTSTRVQRAVRAVFTAWGEPDPYERPRALHWLKNVFTTGMERGDVGLAALRLLLDPEQTGLRSYLTGQTSVASPWRNLNRKRLEQFEEQIESTRNRLDALVSAAGPRRFLSLIHPTATLDFRDLLAQGAWVFVNLQASPNLDREHARVIGTLLIADFIELACQRHGRNGQPPPPAALYVDEAHLYVNHDMAVAFEEGRKFQIYTTLIHQHLNQLKQEDERVFHAVLSAARTKIVFALGSDIDAKQMLHEVFVGEDGVDYTEVKYRHRQTKFRPVQARDRSVTRTFGGGATRSHGASAGRGTTHTHTTGTSDTASHTRARSQGITRTIGHSTGMSAGAAHSVGGTHTTGHSDTRSVADGTTTGTTVSESRTSGSAHTEGQSQSSGKSGGAGSTSHSTTIITGADGSVTRTETDSTTTSDGWNEGQSISSSDTTSESQTHGRAHSASRSRVDTRSEGRNESDAKSWNDATTQGTVETDSRSDGETDSRSRSRGKTKSRSRSVGRGVTKNQATTWSSAEVQSWSRSVSDVAVTRHEEFVEEAVEFFSLEEQRQRMADRLRVPPQRTYTLRRPDCTIANPVVPFRRPIPLPERLVIANEERAAIRNGAVLPQEADAIIARDLSALEDQAQKFAATNDGRVHFGDDPDVEPRFAARLRRRRGDKTLAPGPSGPQGQGGPPHAPPG